VRELEAFELVFYCLCDLAVAVAEAGYGGAAGGIDVVFAGAIDDVNPFALNRERHVDLAVR